MIVMANVISSNVESLSQDSNFIYAKYKTSDVVYEYAVESTALLNAEDTAKELFRMTLAAESIGSFFSKNVKVLPCIKYELLDLVDVDVRDLTKELQRVFEALRLNIHVKVFEVNGRYRTGIARTSI